MFMPSPYEGYVIEITVDANTTSKREVGLALWDTSGYEDYDRVRPLSYPGTHAVLLCYSVDSRESFENVQENV